jgi:hypothetical protein
MEWNAISNIKLLIRPFTTKYGFINHSREPNIRINKLEMSIYSLKNINE